MPATFEISRRSNGQLQFNLKAANDQVILSSQGYKAKSSCLKGVASVRRHGGDASNFVPLLAKDGRPYFALRAGNGRVIGQSQMYADAGGRDGGIRSVIANAPRAAIDDTTS